MYSSQELLQLQNFCDVCDAITACRFITDLPKQSHHIFVGKLNDGRIMDEYPRYDEDDFRAFLTHFRKLRLNKEPTAVFRILKILGRHASDEDKKQFKFYKNEIIEEESAWWLVNRREGSEQIPVTTGELEEYIFYGEVFHLDPEKRVQLKKLVDDYGSLMKLLAFSNYMRFARIVVFYSCKLADYIHNLQVTTPR